MSRKKWVESIQVTKNGKGSLGENCPKNGRKKNENLDGK